MVDDCLLLNGDFNALVDPSEKRGGNFNMDKIMTGFQNFIHNMQVVDCVPKNGDFTCNNRRTGFLNIVERLDKFLVGLDGFKMIYIMNLRFCLFLFLIITQ